MHKVKLLWGKLVTILFLGFVVLGIGCSSWALFNIWGQSHYAPLKALRIPAQSANVEPYKPLYPVRPAEGDNIGIVTIPALHQKLPIIEGTGEDAVSYTHLRAHETDSYLVCRLL